MRRSGVRPRPGGGVSVRLTPGERALLRGLLPQLRPVLAGEQDVGGAVDRLYPPGYDDPDAEAEYRLLVGDSLVSQRLEALEAFTTTLEGGRDRGRWWTTELDADEAHAWLGAINDARLVLGCVSGVTDESQWDRGPDPDEPASVALYYLGWLQEELLAALSSGWQDTPTAP